MISVKKALVLLTACSCLAQASTKTLQIRVPEGVDEITYDASQVTLQNLNRWLTLSPILSQNNNYLVPETIASCDIKDPAYTGCGRKQVRLNVANAKLGLERIRQRLDRLRHEQFPSDFVRITDYFEAVQSFALWRNQQQIAYLETKNISSLESKYPGLNLDPKASCAGVLEKIQRASSEMTVWNLVLTDWANCMWKQLIAAIHEYPQAAWDAALKARGIREHLVVQENE